ncbi:MAG: shikimate dehydrogenase [Pseudomonadota bacterium]
MTRAYAEVIGDPIAHSKSPLIHNFWLEKLGIDAEYHACHVRPDQLADYFANRRQDPDWRGCNVTIPHKQVAAAAVDGLLPGTLEIGAINTVIKWNDQLVGANTDIVGITQPLDILMTRLFGGSLLPQQNVAIIGAGGAACAAVAAVGSRFPAWLIRILARRPEQALTIGIVADIWPIDDTALEGVTVLINASPLGMVGKDPLNLSLEAMRGSQTPKIIFDMVYAPLETPLLAKGQSEGFSTIDGLQMLVAQAAEAFELFFGVPAPRDHDDELRVLLVK